MIDSFNFENFNGAILRNRSARSHGRTSWIVLEGSKTLVVRVREASVILRLADVRSGRVRRDARRFGFDDRERAGIGETLRLVDGDCPDRGGDDYWTTTPA